MKTSGVSAILESYQQGLVPVGTPLTVAQQVVLENTLEHFERGIKDTADRESAEPLLLALAALQEHLATLCFRFQVTLSDRLREFVRVYDRSDIPEERDRMYARVMQNK